MFTSVDKRARFFGGLLKLKSQAIRAKSNDKVFLEKPDSLGDFQHCVGVIQVLSSCSFVLSGLSTGHEDSD